MDGRDGGSAAKGRAEIDNRRPFNSVKEAVSLFGQTLSFTTPDLRTAKFKQCNHEPGELNPKGNVVSELEGAKRNLEMAAKETKSMANQLTCLKEELKKTREELQQFRDLQESKKRLTKMMEDLLDVEDLVSPNWVDEQKERDEGASFAHSNPSRKKKNKLFDIPKGLFSNKRKSKRLQPNSQSRSSTQIV